jgi:TRAP-type mannitol/chloroaromatic compound transport system permease small subunit
MLDMQTHLPGVRGFSERIGSGLLLITQWVALLGGLLVVALALMSVLSILGRWLAGMEWVREALPWVSSIGGDFELIEMGTAVAVFSFLPYTQMKYGHVTVDIFVDMARPRVKAALTLLGNTLFFMASAVLTWRLWHGLGDKLAYNESTMILGLPIWYGYVPGVIFLGLLTLACLYTMIEAGADTFSADPSSTRSVRVHADVSGGE